MDVEQARTVSAERSLVTRADYCIASYCFCRDDPVAARQVDRIMTDMKTLLDDYKLLRVVRRGCTPSLHGAGSLANHLLFTFVLSSLPHRVRFSGQLGSSEGFD